MSARPLFHHNDAGTPEEDWLTDPRWGRSPLVDVPALADRYDELLVLAAHPDDETLAVGGLVAAAHRAGLEVRVLLASRGEASHPESPVWTPVLLGRVRSAEARAAVGRLAPGARLEQLGLPDGGLTAVEDELVAAVAERCGRRSLLLAPWAGDGHPDHEAAGRAARRAAADVGAAVTEYPLWLWHWGGADDLPWERAHVVELDPEAAAARASAVAEYPSQTRPLGPGRPDAPVVTAAVLRRARRLVELVVADDGVLPVRRPRVSGDVAAPFDAMYDAGSDPWGFVDSFYERRKRALTLALLGRERYSRVLEIGCATGVLTRDLARRADRVDAMDVSAEALQVAREGAPDSVRWLHGATPADLPDGPFDLVVVSEVAYFLTPVELLETLRRVRDTLTDDGEVVLVDWRHPTSDVPLDGPAVHDQARSALADLPHRVHLVEDDLFVDVWGGGPTSVAGREGLV